MNEPTTNDLRALVADAIGDALGDLNLTREALNRAADDVLDAVLALGGVSDEDANECARVVAYWLGPAQPIRALVTRAIVTACAERDAEIEHDWQRTIPDDGLWCQRCGLAYVRWGGQECNPDGALARVEAAMLVHVERAKARAERAEAALLDLYDACWTDNDDDFSAHMRKERGDVEFMAAYVKAHLEADAAVEKQLRAQVQRVREYLDSEDTNGHPDRVVKLREVRAALDVEADR